MDENRGCHEKPWCLLHQRIFTVWCDGHRGRTSHPGEVPALRLRWADCLTGPAVAHLEPPSGSSSPMTSDPTWDIWGEGGSFPRAPPLELDPLPADDQEQGLGPPGGPLGLLPSFPYSKISYHCPFLPCSPQDISLPKFTLFLKCLGLQETRPK